MGEWTHRDKLLTLQCTHLILQPLVVDFGVVVEVRCENETLHFKNILKTFLRGTALRAKHLLNRCAVYNV